MSSKIRIRNLPPGTERFDVQDLLTMVGDVHTIRLVVEHGEQTAYVRMVSEGHAQNCIDRFNKQRYRGHMLSVCEDIVKPARAIGAVK